MGEWLMGFYKKTILLTNRQNYDKGMTVLTIEKNNSGVFGNIKAYDFDAKNMVLGISVNGEKLVKQNVIFANDNAFTFKLDNNFDINARLGCVLCSRGENGYTPLLWGANENRAELKQDVINLMEKENDLAEQKMPKSQEIKADYNTMQSAMQKMEKCENLANIDALNNVKDGSQNQVLKSDEKAKLFENDDDEVDKIIDKELGEPQNFFDLVGDQIDELFDKFPHDENLAKLIPNSKWVRVDYDGIGKDYIIGLIYEDDTLKYICYGVPGEYNTQPPQELLKFSQWLPVDPSNPDIGFWVMFQDATTGDSIEIDDMAL